MESEHYDLIWHTFSDHVGSMLQEMLSSTDFSDVTIVSEDGKAFKAHRNILAASSIVLKSIFEIDREKPTIFLREVFNKEIEPLLQFIYSGATKIHQDDVEDFLKVAKSLKIKQLEDEIYTGENEDLNTVENDEIDVVELEEMITEEFGEIDAGVDEMENQDDALKFTKLKEPDENDEGESKPSNVNSKVDTEKLDTGKFKGKFKCKHCEKCLISEHGLKGHMERYHGDTRTRLKCRLCDKTYLSDESLSVHIKVSHEGFSFECDKCEKKFTNPIMLKNHIRVIHNGIPFQCKKCDYTSNNTQSLYLHNKSKHDGKKYDCTECDFQANAPTTLKYHKESKHDGIKYPCNECDYRGNSQMTLKYHKDTKHEGKKYFCTECDYQANNPSTLKYHKDTKHDGKTYPRSEKVKQCSLCDYTGFSHQFYYHNKTRH